MTSSTNPAVPFDRLNSALYREAMGPGYQFPTTLEHFSVRTSKDVFQRTNR